jgi:murein DD-endopeptidase MepM/ murein hydrolase activator NlpD
VHARGSRHARRDGVNTRRHAWARSLRCGLAAAAGASLLAAAPGASAADGGTALPPTPPVITAYACVKACNAAGGLTSGSTLRVRGRNLAGARSVRFNGGTGTKDDVDARARNRTASKLEVTVPAKARTGTIAVVGEDGGLSSATKRRLVIGAPDGTAALASVGVSARVPSPKIYFYGRRKATLEYALSGSSAKDVRVDLVRTSDRVSVAHWIAYGVPAGTTHKLTWNGKSGARVPRAGTYEFRVAVGPQPRPVSRRATAQAVQSSSPADPPPPVKAARAGSFRYLPHVFPIRGPHDYGQSGARFGAGRAGHTHQGQDMMAPCGTPLVAARGGTVYFKKWQWAAGNYVVIDTAGSGVDEVYMHLREPAIVEKGQKVYTGQRIGDVGATGHATGCHLHFEMWSAPGWQRGGSPFDPEPSLLAWDKVS